MVLRARRGVGSDVPGPWQGRRQARIAQRLDVGELEPEPCVLGVSGGFHHLAKRTKKSTMWKPRTLRRSVGSRPTRGQRSACTSSPRRPCTARWKGAGPVYVVSHQNMERNEPFKTRTTSDYSNTWAAAHTMTSAAAAGRAGTFSARSPTSYSGASRRAGPRATGGTAYPAHGGVARRQGAPESQSSGSSAWLDARVCRHRRSGARPTSLQGQTDRQIIGRTNTTTPDR